MKNREMDNYTICLLGWYFGILPGNILENDWTQEDIDKAQAYCEMKHVDPELYWMRVGAEEVG